MYVFTSEPRSVLLSPSVIEAIRRLMLEPTMPELGGRPQIPRRCTRFPDTSRNSIRHRLRSLPRYW